MSRLEQIRTAVVAVLTRSGGFADRRSLVRAVGRRGLERALAAKFVLRLARGLYASPDGEETPARLAARHGAILTGLSAAKHLGWELLSQPTRVEVGVRHHRRLPQHKRLRARRIAVEENEIHEGICTSPLRTVLDCAARLPFEEALAVADSALRHGALDPDDLLKGARAYRGRRRVDVLKVAATASGEAAGPFESVLRVRALDAGLEVRPQHKIRPIDATYRVDLADRARRLVLEGDSFEFHSSPEAFRKDCVRYSELTAAGWTVLRMPYHQVVEDPDWCARILATVRRRWEEAFRAASAG